MPIAVGLEFRESFGVSGATLGLEQAPYPHPKWTRIVCGIEKSPFSCERSLIGSRRDAELLPERCDEVGRRRVPGSVRHVGDRKAWLTKEVHRSLAPPRHHKLMWRRPTYLAKRTDEVVRADAGCCRKFSESR